MKTAKVTKTKKTTAPKTKRAVAAAPAPKAKASAPKTVKASTPKPVTAAAPVRKITAEEIARRAYFIWERQGRPAGREREHWLLAEQELKAA